MKLKRDIIFTLTGLSTTNPTTIGANNPAKLSAVFIILCNTPAKFGVISSGVIRNELNMNACKINATTNRIIASIELSTQKPMNRISRQLADMAEKKQINLVN